MRMTLCNVLGKLSIDSEVIILKDVQTDIEWASVEKHHLEDVLPNTVNANEDVKKLLWDEINCIYADKMERIIIEM